MNDLVHVTDHAVLRFLERAHGLDVELVRKHLSGMAVNAVRLGAIGVTIDNVKLVIRDASVVTVMRPGWPVRDQDK
jgi:hypothetical protein